MGLYYQMIMVHGPLVSENHYWGSGHLAGDTKRSNYDRFLKLKEAIGRALIALLELSDPLASQPSF